MTEDGLSENAAPYERLIQTESKRIVYNFCTLCSLIENEKINQSNIFQKLIQDEEYQKLYMKMLSEDNFIESLKTFLLIYPEIITNKSVKAVLSTWK